MKCLLLFVFTGLLLSCGNSPVVPPTPPPVTQKADSFKGYLILTPSDFAKISDSLKDVAREEAAQVFLDSMATAFTKYEDVNEYPPLVDSVGKKTYQLAAAPMKGSERVYVDGLFLRPAIGSTRGDYSMTADGRITLNTPPSRWIFVYSQKPVK